MDLENDLKSYEIDKKFIEDVARNNEYNLMIGDYYQRLYKESKDDKLTFKHERLMNCNKFWILDKYQIQAEKIFKKTTLCDDKFCNNCKKAKQQVRMDKFIPLIKPFKKKMYQLTLTVPNVKGEDLKDTISQMFKSFAHLIRILKNEIVIDGIDLDQVKYEGAIRSLEITYKGNEYHPHLHALVVLDINPFDDIMIRKHKNAYSKDYKGKRAERLFSDFEIIIQKIWYLLNNKKRVTKKNIEELSKGYSCQLDKFQESDFIELFKYMTKATNEDDKPLSYKQFKTLYYALLGTRQIQGYGCFYGLKDAEAIKFLEDMKEEFELYQKMLQEKEKPIEVYEAPVDLAKDTKYRITSFKRFLKDKKKLLDT